MKKIILLLIILILPGVVQSLEFPEKIGDFEQISHKFASPPNDDITVNHLIIYKNAGIECDLKIQEIKDLQLMRETAYDSFEPKYIEDLKSEYRDGVFYSDGIANKWFGWTYETMHLTVAPHYDFYGTKEYCDCDCTELFDGLIELYPSDAEIIMEQERERQLLKIVEVQNNQKTNRTLEKLERGENIDIHIITPEFEKESAEKAKIRAERLNCPEETPVWDENSGLTEEEFFYLYESCIDGIPEPEYLIEQGKKNQIEKENQKSNEKGKIYKDGEMNYIATEEEKEAVNKIHQEKMEKIKKKANDSKILIFIENVKLFFKGIFS